MSNTSYQRAVRDMRQAGLNPALAYGQGGASSPSGASAPVIPEDLGSAVSKGLATAMEIKRFRQEMSESRSRTELNELTSETQKAIEQKERATGEGQRLANRATKAQLPTLEAEAELDRKLVPVDAGLKRIPKALQAIFPFMLGRFSRGTKKGEKSVR